MNKTFIPESSTFVYKKNEHNSIKEPIKQAKPPPPVVKNEYESIINNNNPENIMISAAKVSIFHPNLEKGRDNKL
tara:strand:+ start:1254 stop:1478 length:225 start_codon:yes stop_codon:yes gene_type:complete